MTTTAFKTIYICLRLLKFFYFFYSQHEESVESISEEASAVKESIKYISIARKYKTLTRPRGFKAFSCSTQLSMKFSLLSCV